MANMIALDRMESSGLLKLAAVSNSVHTYLNYRKKMQTRLAELNDNVSNVIKDSCLGIDTICNKVRQCLTEMDKRDKGIYLTDEITEYEILEEATKSQEEISQDIEDMDDSTLIEDVEENDAEHVEEIPSSLTPFYTVINPENSADPNKKEICHKQILNKTIYSLMNKDESPLEQNEENLNNFDGFDERMETLCNSFEEMDKLVDDINNEICKFSETAIYEEKHSQCDYTEFKHLSGLKPIKRLSKKNSKQKCIQVGDYLSQTSTDLVEMVSLVDRQDDDSNETIIPDVYRKRAFTNLYKKLVTQVEANDSLIFFQTLMKRQRKHMSNQKKMISQMRLNIPVMNYSTPKRSVSTSSNRIKPKTDLNKKYAGSLWFSPRSTAKNSSKSGRSKTRKDIKNNAANRTVENRSLNSERGHIQSERKSRQRKIIVESLTPPKPTASSENVQKSLLECACKVVVHNDMPSSPSTKCHLQWLKAKEAQAPMRKLEFLDILDDLTHRDLQPLHSEYPRRDNQQPRELDYKDVQDTYLYKLLYGKQYTKNVWRQLIEPTVRQPKKRNVHKPRSSQSRKSREETVSDNFMEKFSTQNYSKSEVLKTLAPYMYDPETLVENYSNTVIVMPVRVYYDNCKLNEPPTKLNSSNKSSLSLLKKFPAPSKDNTSPKRNKSTPRTSKPMKVVYDSLPKKPELTPSAKHLTISPRLPTNSSKSGLENQLRKVTSRSFSPRSFASFCQSNRAVHNIQVEPQKQKNIEVYNKIQADINKIKKEVYGKKMNQADKKLWAHKYGKSVGQQLITFVKHQEPEAVRPVPQYAMPKHQFQPNVSEKQTTNSIFKGLSPQKQMLRQVQNLKGRNEMIQNNIKKAIEVIETRMVDILCDDSNSVEAFDVMEKEITHVLNQMKCKAKTNLKTISSRCESKEKIVSNLRTEEDALEENYNIISDKLFERLEKILDTGGSSVSNVFTDKSREIIQKKQKAEEVRKKHKLSSMRRTKTDFLSPSTSASMDEKIVARRSPRSSVKKTEKSETISKPQTRIITTPITISNLENCGDQNTVKDTPTFNEIYMEQNDTKDTEEKNYEEPILQISGGDYAKYEDAVENNIFDIIETNNITIENVISDDKVEKLISEDNLEVSTTLSDLIENNKTYNIEVDAGIKKIIREEVKAAESANESESNTNNLGADTEAEEFINEEINKVIDSIVMLEEEANTKEPQEEQNENFEAKAQNEEPENVNSIEKDNFESSNYNTPTSGRSDIGKIVQAVEQESLPHNQEETLEIIEKGENYGTSLKPATAEGNIQTDTEAEFKDAEETDSKATDQEHEPKKEDSNTPRSKPTEVEQNKKIVKESDANKQEQVQSNYSEQVQKIIKRVEDIYSQLDDIQDSDLDKIPVFSEPDITDVHSEMFLTPFMQAVKETRQNSNNTDKTGLIQRSPSYYNVMTFLDALTNIQKEVACEVHFARLYHYVRVVRQAIVCYVSEIWYEARYYTSTCTRSSCLKKNPDHSKHTRCKRVSFHQIHKEDKSSQVTLCPFHKVKVLRISSQQFPPLERNEEISEETCVLKRKCYKINGEREENKHTEKTHVCTAPRNVHSPNDLTTHKTTKKLCELHGSGDQKPLCVKENDTKTEVGCGKINRHESVIGDKSTQVFCQMQKSGENSTSRSVTKENVQLTMSSEQSVDSPACIEGNTDDSKSTEKIFLDNSLVDPFYDYANENVTAQVITQKIESVHEENKETNVSDQFQPKIAVFKQSLEDESLLPPININNINDIELYKKRLEKRKELRLMRKSSTEIVRHRAQDDNKNVVLLKSFYAIVYILMFTALSLDYRCL